MSIFNNKNKFIAIVVAIIVIGLISWAGYSLIKPTHKELPKNNQKAPSVPSQPPSQPPSQLPSQPSEVPNDQFKGWKTYRNEKYGFEVKYPGNWTLIENSKEQIGFFEPGHSPGKEYLGDIFINVINNPNKLTIDEYIQGKPSVIEDVGTMIIAGRTARQIKESGMLEFKTTVIPMKDYFIEITKEENYRERRDKIYNQILSTFKFVE